MQTIAMMAEGWAGINIPANKPRKFQKKQGLLDSNGTNSNEKHTVGIRLMKCVSEYMLLHDAKICK